MHALGALQFARRSKALTMSILNKTFSRREISTAAALTLLGGAIITVSGCGGGSGDDGGSGTDRTAAISANHNHTSTISKAELDAGNALTLNIQGTSSHPHTIQLTAAEVISVRKGTRVAKTSSVDFGHDHIVTFN